MPSTFYLMRLNEEAKKQHIVCDKEKEKWALTKRLICFQNCKKVGRYLIDNPQHKLSTYLQLDSKGLPHLIHFSTSTKMLMLYLWLYRIVFGSFLHPWKDNFLGWRWRSGNNSWSSTSTKAITFGWGCADRCLLVIQTWQRSLTGQPIIHSEMYLVGNHCKITLIFIWFFFTENGCQPKNCPSVEIWKS